MLMNSWAMASEDKNGKRAIKLTLNLKDKQLPFETVARDLIDSQSDPIAKPSRFVNVGTATCAASWLTASSASPM